MKKSKKNQKHLTKNGQNRKTISSKGENFPQDISQVDSILSKQA